MPNADRISTVGGYGFTDRQARFLVRVLEHSGVCLPRQYRTFAGIAHGRQTHQFFDRLIAGGFATTDLAAPAHGGRIYHLQYKPWYRALGEADHRHRKPVSVGRAVERLMVLDGVLAEPNISWLGLSRDKVETFTNAPWCVSIATSARPGRACDTTWWPTGAGTSRGVEGLSAGTYYWQARTAGGGVLADNGTWYAFTVTGTPAAAAAPGAPPTRADDLWTLAGLVSLGGLVVLAGASRRRRIVVAGVVVGVLMPVTALAQTTTQVIEYYTTDALGSVRAVTKQVNGTCQVVARHDFMPFGEEVSPQNPPQDKRLFTGKERDSETGLDYFEARYLRSGDGRFMTVHPLAASGSPRLPQSWNRYTYTLGNPLRYVDPTGELWIATDVSGNYRWMDSRGRGLTCYKSVATAIGGFVMVYGSKDSSDISVIAPTNGTYTDLATLAAHHDAHFELSRGVEGRFLTSKAAVGLFNLSGAYADVFTADRKLLITDAGNAQGTSFGPHKEHADGAAFDMGCMDSAGRVLYGVTAAANADNTRMRFLVGQAQANGFDRIFSARPRELGTAYALGHDNHLHVGTTRPIEKILPRSK